MKILRSPVLWPVVLALLATACAEEARPPGEFELSAMGGLSEASVTGEAFAWFNVAGEKPFLEIRLEPTNEPARHVVLTSPVDEWPAVGTYQVTENAPTAKSFDLLYTLDVNRVVRGTRGTVEILESGDGELRGRISVAGVLIDLTSPGAGLPSVKLAGTFHATCGEIAGETEC